MRQECAHCGESFDDEAEGYYHDGEHCGCDLCLDPEIREALKGKAFCDQLCEAHYMDRHGLFPAEEDNP